MATYNWHSDYFQSYLSYEKLGKTCGKYESNLWQTCGKPVANLWQTSGKYMANL